ncbi:hypothetical protein DICVIV_05903 [Dictyocaulus viviparus]|uniref:Chromatin target of PRMT1 protein C-terminal domain-containing protein n=1 Tax=Dictyocaulus viviparus TaxID=29172 RepID=A0A0D8Y084_DICVI|nr:hypothetical protein DICVIV_05903 [Dictyocaulus viviparus]
MSLKYSMFPFLDYICEITTLLLLVKFQRRKTVKLQLRDMTDTEMADGVPTKIVMVGTSNISLHQSRFGHDFVFEVIADEPMLTIRGSVRGKMRGQNMSSRRGAVMRSEPVYELLQPVSTDLVEEYVPFASSQLRRMRAPVLYKRPIEERVTLPPTPEVVYVPVPISRNQRKPRGYRGRGVQRYQGQRNNVRGVLNNAYFKSRGNAGRGSRVWQGRGISKGMPPGHYPPLAKKSISQLDRELEDYMRKSKHPKIIV